MSTMTNTLALSNARITSPSGISYSRVQVAIGQGVVSLADQAGVTLGTQTGVVSVLPDSSAGGWLVRFEDGEVWTISRVRGCGCGGGL